MLQAIPPFYHRDPDVMYGLIQKQELKFKTSVHISDEAKDLIAKVSICILISYCKEIQKKDWVIMEDSMKLDNINFLKE